MATYTTWFNLALPTVGGDAVAWASYVNANSEIIDAQLRAIDLELALKLEDAPSDGNEYVRKNATWAVATGGGGGGAPTDAQYLVAAASAGLSAERVLADSIDIEWDFSTPGAASASIRVNSIATDRLDPIAATSVLANALDSPSDVVAFSATASGQVLQRAGTTLAWAALPLTAMATQAANTIVANATGGAAAPTAVGLASSLQFSGGVLDVVDSVLTPAWGNITGIPADFPPSVHVHIPSEIFMTGPALVGRETASAGAAASITVGSTLQFSGGSLGVNNANIAPAWANITGVPGTFPPSAHTHPISALDNIAALTILGNATNASAAVTAIAAGSDGHVMRRSGTALGFGTLAAGAFADNTIAFARLANTTGPSVLGRDNAASGPIAPIVCGAFSFDVLRGNGSGDIEFGTLLPGSFADNTIALTRLADIATARILGRDTAGSGAVEALTGTEATALLDVFTNLLKGLVPASGGGTANYLRADGAWAAPPGGGGLTKFSATFGDGVASSFVISHSLGTRNVVVSVYRTGTPWEQVLCDIEHTSTSDVTLRFDPDNVPASGEFTVVVIG